MSGSQIDQSSEMTLKDLIQILYSIFESDGSKKESIMEAMTRYRSREEDWEKYAIYSDICYTRNLMDKGNGQFNLMVLAWKRGQTSSVHSHSDSSCFMKILAGSVAEIRYPWPEDAGGTMSPTDTYIRQRDEVAFIEDSLGLHEMSNASEQNAVTLHLYCPPYDTCLTFAKATGSSKICYISYFSIDGEVQVPEEEQGSLSEDGSSMKGLTPCC